MSSKQVKSAMGIALPPVMMALPALRILLVVANKTATQSAYSRTLPPAHKPMGAAQAVAAITAITIAAPVAVIVSLKETNFVMAIAQPRATIPTVVRLTR